MGEQTEARRKGSRGLYIDPAIGKQIRELREEHDETRQRLSTWLGVDQRTLARWELEGTFQDNLDRVKVALGQMGQGMEGGFPEPPSLNDVSTIDLAVELLKRARLIELRDRRLLEFRKHLSEMDMEYLWPEGL